MKVIKTIEEMKEITQLLTYSGKTIGFVPTMGYLHEGHLSLINKARSENDTVILSIFVNPLQFGPNEDFDKYPRDIVRDEKLACENGVDYLFYPSQKEMYKGEASIQVKVVNRVDVLCGKQRVGHFDGVATVLMKLFNIIQPKRAYFGMKDAQQVAVVDSVIEDFNFPIKLIPVETIREEDGLAKSSRNIYLTETERHEASRLFESLMLAKSAIENGQREVGKVVQLIEECINNHTSGKIDYVSILSYPELKPIQKFSGKVIIAVAVKFTNARLIDNITMVI